MVIKQTSHPIDFNVCVSLNNKTGIYEYCIIIFNSHLNFTFCISIIARIALTVLHSHSSSSSYTTTTTTTAMVIVVLSRVIVLPQRTAHDSGLS